MAKPNKRRKQTLAQKNSAAIARANANTLPDWLQPLTSAQIASQAAQQARDAQRSESLSLASQIAQAQSSANRRSSVAGSLYSMLGGALPGIAQGIQSTYESAAKNQQTAGQGFSDTYRSLADANAQADSQLLQQQGASQGQISGAENRNAGADSLYGTGGYIPSGSLGQEGAGWAAYARSLPSAAAGMGRMQIADLQRSSAEAQAPLFQQQANLAAELPGLISQNQQALMGQQLDAWKAAEDWKMQQKAYAAAQKLARQQRGQQRFENRHTQTQDAIDIAAASAPPPPAKFSLSASRDSHFKTDTDGNFMLNAKGQKIPYGSGNGKKAAAKKAIRDELLQYVKDVGKPQWVKEPGVPAPVLGPKITDPNDPLAEIQLYVKRPGAPDDGHGPYTANPADAATKADPTETYQPGQSWGDTFNAVVRRLRAALKQYGVREAEIKRMARELIQSYGA